MNGNRLFYRVYLAGYLSSAIFYLATVYFDGNAKSFFVAAALCLVVSVFLGPFLFYRVLFRHSVWIPGGVEYGPNSGEWEWRFFSALTGLAPICIFLYLATT